MFKRVDIAAEKISGFSYMSKTNMIESVTLKDHWVDISVSDGTEKVSVYYEDIPKLVRALQAAHDHKE